MRVPPSLREAASAVNVANTEVGGPAERRDGVLDQFLGLCRAFLGKKDLLALRRACCTQ